jgi:predicted dinucleotide-binding enzyme
MQIAIIGIGNVGAALGQRWAAVGHDVLFGVRQPGAAKVRPSSRKPARAGRRRARGGCRCRRSGARYILTRSSRRSPNAAN